MNIGFYLERSTFLKTLGSLIETCHAHSHNVFLYYEKPNRSLGDKLYQAIKPNMLTAFSIPPDRIQEIDNFSKMVTGPKLDVLVVHEGYHTLNAYLSTIERLRARGTKVVSLVHFFEIAQRPLEALDFFDLTIYPSEFCCNLHFLLQSTPGKAQVEKQIKSHSFAISGAPMYDQIRNVSRNDARAELQIAPNKKVVLLIAPVISPNTPWRFHVWGKKGRLKQTKVALSLGKWQFIWEIWTGKRFDDIAHAIRRFCDQNQAILIVKSRGKQKDLSTLLKVANSYFDGMDDQYYPVFTTYKLMAASDLCITVNSMAAVEAVATGIPCINIYVPHNDLVGSWPKTHFKYHDALGSGKPGSLMNYQGCITKIDRRRFISWIEKKDINDFPVNEIRRGEYLHKFLGIEEKLASQRILEVLEYRYNGKIH